MPPKRAASGSSAPAKKKAKKPVKEPPRSKRWSAVSASANADGDYKTTWENPTKWYSFITICSPIRDGHNEDEDEEEEEEEGEGEEEDNEEDNDVREGPRCGRKHCQCFKPAKNHPEYPWLVSQAGYRKYRTQFIHLSLRDPDNFNMYTFNDHAGYGCLQIVQNLLLDYVEAAERGWREQWAVCEGLALWLLSPASAIMFMIDDGQCVDATIRLVGRMFLDMLARLDGRGLVGDATDVKSIGTVMAMYIKMVSQMREVGILDGDIDSDSDSDSKEVKTETFDANHFDDAILSYANQHGVTLQGPEDIDELIVDLNGEVELPRKGTDDPWGWKAKLEEYKRRYGEGRFGIGGDSLDITTWSSAERKEASFSHKDPLGKRERDAIKEGMVMRLG